jgi:hypothetical protein
LARISDAQRKSAQRAKERDLRISRVFDPIRRRDCLADSYLFLKTYFGGIFSQPFTSDRREMVDAIERAAMYGGDQAVAGPRGDGKTRSALFVSLKLELAGKLRFPIVVSKSGPRATRELKNLKDAIRNSEPLRRDFPEVFEPVLALGGWASKARQQTAYGQFTNLEWAEECIILPTIPTELLRANRWDQDIESAACGQIFASLGVEGPIRGYSIRNERPDLALLDDIDDRESARSELQTQTRESIIEEDIGGLAGPDKTIARVMLCTLINRTCVAATYTDRAKKPSWKGQRHKLLAVMPERADLWEEYIALRKGRGDDDPDARKAHEFYLANREPMDAGAVVTNPYRFDNRPLADGEPGQVSALQACFDLIADRDWEHFNTEYQNDPPEEDGPIESGISAGKIQARLSGYPRRVVPPECVALTQGVDVQKAGLYWVVKAWRADATNYVVDYGYFETHGTTYGSDEGIELAILRALLGRMEQYQVEPCRKIDGEVVDLDLTLIDSGWQTSSVYQACREIGLGVYPAKGHGKSHGCAAPNFHDALKRTIDRKPGDGWFMARQQQNTWLVHCDTDRWKSFEHARWLTPQAKPGAAYLFGEATDEELRYADKKMPREAKEHFAFAKHLTAEIEVEEVVRGSLKRMWKTKAGRVQNHYLDASYLADVAAAIKGVRLLSDSQPAPVDRPSMAELKRRAKEARAMQ